MPSSSTRREAAALREVHCDVQTAIRKLALGRTYAEDGALDTACRLATEAAELLKNASIQKAQSIRRITSADR